ncbi:MAG: multiheme c-type cytochrome [Planctomycetota bacterium]
MPNASPTPPAPREILSPWQKPLVRALLLGTILVAGTGLFLVSTPGASPSAQSALIVHLVVGALLVPVLLVFAIPHAVAQTKRKPFIALSGAVVLLAALAAAGTGVSLVAEPTGASASTGTLHAIAGFAVLGLYLLHRRFGTNPARWSVLGAGVAAAAAVGLGLHAWEQADPGRVSIFESGSAAAAEAAREHFFPSSVTSGAGDLTLTSDDLRDLEGCATCHQVITDEWKRSAHRHASMTNPFYRAAILDLRKRFPKQDARWCAGCHDPALLFKKDEATGLSLIAAPELDMLSEDARTGLTCIACHAIEPRSTNGNADYVLRSRKVYAGEKSDSELLRKAHDVMLRLKPKAHVESMRPHNVSESSYCSVCHKAEPPPELTRWRWARAQDEYDAHDDSGVSMGNARSFYHPPAAKRCQDCHMPLVEGKGDPAADEKGMVRSHLFGAANTALPFLRGDTAMIDRIKSFLSTACRVDITQVILPGGRAFLPAPVALPEVKPGEVVEAHVVVRNLGVGHAFPAGTVDSNEVWLAFEANVAGQPAFYASGRIDPVTGELDPSAEQYRAYWERRDGTRFVSRVANDLYTLIYARRIGPGTADVVRYRFRVPEGATGALELKATLKYRKFSMAHMRNVADVLGSKDGYTIEHRLEKDYLVPGDTIEVDLRKMPIVDMATTKPFALRITPEGTPGAPPDPTTLKLQLPDDRDRINDLAIAHLIQGDPDRARELFRLVTRIDPKYADGYVNVARAAMAKQDAEDATAAIGQAFDVYAARGVPPHAKAYFFRAIARRNSPGGDFAGAEADLRTVLKTFPRDRETHRRLADVLFQQDKFREALDVCDAFMKIDAQDWEIWYWAMRAYQALGDEPRAAAAKAAHDKYRPDDDFTNRRGPTLLEDPDIHRLAQPIHVHVQPGVK